MAKKKVLTEEEIAEGTPAQDSIQTHSSADQSKVGMMSSMMSMMGNMSKGDLTEWFYKAMALIGHEADAIPDGTAQKNAATIQAKGSATGAFREDVSEIFGSQELTEEFKNKATTLFEAAVNSRVSIVEAELTEQFEKALEEEVENIYTDLEDKVDQYISYACQEWLNENEVAIESSLKNEISESLFENLREVFLAHNIQIPEAKVDVVESLTEELDLFESKLDETISENIELKKQIDTFKKQQIFSESVKDLTPMEAEKIRVIVEGLECDVDSYSDKIKIIKEQHLVSGKKTPKSNILVEEVNHDAYADGEHNKKTIDPLMGVYVNAISRTKVKNQ